jgi:hypothetical protein
MEVRIYDEEAEDKYITMDEFIRRMEEENSKKNFRNWFNKRFGGYAGYNAYYLLFHPWEILLEWKRQIKYAWQRVFRGWDDRVAWDIGYYISKMLPLWLEQLRNNKHGIPMEMFDGLPYEDEINYTHSEESWKIATERWNGVLDEIISGFNAYKNNNILEGEEREKFNKGMALFVKHFENLWD